MYIVKLQSAITGLDWIGALDIPLKLILYHNTCDLTLYHIVHKQLSIIRVEKHM